MPDIPIIGREMDVLTWFVTVLINCRCDLPRGLHPIALTGEHISMCPACRKSYAIGGFDANGQPQIMVSEPSSLH